jgi:hypothetical protein
MKSPAPNCEAKQQHPLKRKQCCFKVAKNAALTMQHKFKKAKGQNRQKQRDIDTAAPIHHVGAVAAAFVFCNQSQNNVP